MVTGTVETGWLEGLVEGYLESWGESRDGRSLGFHDWMMDCAEAADFVISFTGDSVAIDRVNCLLNAVVAGYSQKVSPLVISKTFRLSLNTPWTQISSAQPWPRQGTQFPFQPFPTVTLCKCLAVALPLIVRLE